MFVSYWVGASDASRYSPSRPVLFSWSNGIPRSLEPSVSSRGPTVNTIPFLGVAWQYYEIPAGNPPYRTIAFFFPYGLVLLLLILVPTFRFARSLLKRRKTGGEKGTVYFLGRSAAG